jgi:hypothetical protein
LEEAVVSRKSFSRRLQARDARELLSDLGCEQRAFDIRHRVVEFLCSALPADHPDIAIALMKKAASLSLLGRFTKALENSERALSLPPPHGITSY